MGAGVGKWGGKRERFWARGMEGLAGSWLKPTQLNYFEDCITSAANRYDSLVDLIASRTDQSVR